MEFFSADKAAALTTEDVLQRLESNTHGGLTTKEADRRIRVHGHNEFEIAKEEPLWRKYLDQVRFKKHWKVH